MVKDTILLIDADSKIPNLALMKLSTYYKSKGYKVELKQCHLPYFPNKKKFVCYVDTDKYLKVFCSVVFSDNDKYIIGKNIKFGGTGYDLTTTLPDYIETLQPDYSIYPDNKSSYGFISRGCIRNCYFCVVSKKEGYIRQVNTIDNIVNPKFKITTFLDNNFLALPNHKELLQELIDKKIKVQFNQGLDIRLIDEENSVLLSKLKYYGKYIFAFDDWKYKSILDRKLPILNKWAKPDDLRFYIYISPSMPLWETVYRVLYIKENNQLPYLMRDIKIFKSKYKNFYTDLTGWCNQPQFFKKMSFHQFMQIRTTNEIKRNIILSLYDKALKKEI